MGTVEGGSVRAESACGMVAEPGSREEMPLGFGGVRAQNILYPCPWCRSPPAAPSCGEVWGHSVLQTAPWWGRAALGGEGCSRESPQVMLSCRKWAEPAQGELGRKGEGMCRQNRFSLDPGRSISKRKGKRDTTVGNISNGKTRILTLIIKTYFPHKNSVFFSCRNTWQLYKLMPDIFSLNFRIF